MSTINFKRDLYDGTDLNVDYASAFRTYATRKFWVRGLTATTKYEDIVAAFETEFGLQHPTINGFPLRTVRVVKISCERAMLIARYQRTPSSFPPLPNGTEAQYRSGYEAIEVFKSAFPAEGGGPVYDIYGLPDGKTFSGPDQLANGDIRPASIERRVPIVRLFTAKQFEVLPTGIGSSFGYVNSAPVTIAGQTWATGVVRFDGFEMDTNVVYGFNGNPLSVVYNVQFIWTLRNGTHVQQAPSWTVGPKTGDPPAPGPGVWEIVVEPSAPGVNFNTLNWFQDL